MCTSVYVYIYIYICYSYPSILFLNSYKSIGGTSPWHPRTAPSMESSQSHAGLFPQRCSQKPPRTVWRSPGVSLMLESGWCRNPQQRYQISRDYHMKIRTHVFKKPENTMLPWSSINFQCVLVWLDWVHGIIWERISGSIMVLTWRLRPFGFLIPLQ